MLIRIYHRRNLAKKGSLLFINDAPYGTEEAYKALRMAMMHKKEQIETADVRIFLMADAVTYALPNQFTPQGYYNIERMLHSVVSKGGMVKAYGIKEITLIEGVGISTRS